MSLLALILVMFPLGIIISDTRMQKPFPFGIIICVTYSAYWSFQPLTPGLDIYQYKSVFDSTRPIFDYALIGNHGLLFNSAMSLVKSFGGNFQLFIFINYLTTTAIFLIAFRKISWYPNFALFIALLLTPTFITMIRLHRQGLAVALTFLAIAYIIKNRHTLFYFFGAIATNIHFASTPYLAVAFLLKKFDKKYSHQILILLLVSVIIIVIGSSFPIIEEILKSPLIPEKYNQRAEAYIFNQNPVHFGLTRQLELIVILGFFAFSLLHTRFKKTILNEQLIIPAALAAFSFILFLSFKWNDLLARLALFSAPFTAVLLVKVTEFVRLETKQLFRIFIILVALTVYLLRILKNDYHRIPFTL